VELRDIRYFTVVAEKENIGRAAETLGLSATALSKSLRRLEISMGAKLVKRAPHGVALTAVGAALRARIGPLQAMLNDVRHEAADLAAGRAGHVNVGAGSGGPEGFLVDACITLSREAGRVTLNVSIRHGNALMDALLKGEIDFFVAGTRTTAATNIVQEHLYDDQYVVFASAAHRLAGRRRITLADLSGERWAWMDTTSRPHWEQLFRALAKKSLPPPFIALETNSQALRIRAIASSDYLGLGSRQFLRQEARKFPLVELPVKEITHVRRMSIIYRRDAYLSPAARRLIEILKAQAKGIASGSHSPAGSPGTTGDRKKRASA
jgi:DNA-binding transcriptional LysR family regulator